MGTDKPVLHIVQITPKNTANPQKLTNQRLHFENKDLVEIFGQTFRLFNISRSHHADHFRSFHHHGRDFTFESR